jgi:glycosyltransferase involved in cell wall biosynthesis
MTPGLVTVITPVFNTERYLAEAIESVLEQDYEPVEMIVVDDGSTDGSADVAARYDEVTLIRQENQGQAVARNVAIEAGSGEFVTPLDADDLMAPGRLSRQVGFLTANPGVAAIIGRQRVILEEGAPPTPWMSDPRTALDLEGADEEQLRAEGLLPFSPPMTMTIRREMFDLVGLFDPTFPVGEDIDFLFRLEQTGFHLERSDELAIYRRVHGANLSYDEAGVRKSVARSFKHRLDRLRAAGSTAGAQE